MKVKHILIFYFSLVFFCYGKESDRSYFFRGYKLGSLYNKRYKLNDIDEPYYRNPKDASYSNRNLFIH